MASSSSSESVNVEAPSAAAPPPPLKTLTFKCSDGKEVETEREIAMQSGTIKNMVEEGYKEIPLLNVDSKTLKKVLRYLTHHYGEKTDDANKEVVLDKFDLKFVHKKSIKKLFDLVSAANYLEIPGLVNLTSKAIADKIQNKSVKAVRTIFNITSDYTRAEEAEILREYGWAHDGEFDDTVDDDDDDDDDTSEDDGESTEGKSKSEDGGETEGKSK